MSFHIRLVAAQFGLVRSALRNVDDERQRRFSAVSAYYEAIHAPFDLERHVHFQIDRPVIVRLDAHLLDVPSARTQAPVPSVRRFGDVETDVADVRRIIHDIDRIADRFSRGNSQFRICRMQRYILRMHLLRAESADDTPDQRNG